MSTYKRIDLSERISIQASIEKELSLEEIDKAVYNVLHLIYLERR